MRSVYVVATGRDVGKTTMSLGLVSFLSAQGLSVRFLKPVGQQYVVQDGKKIDKDAVLLRSALSVEGSLSDMSPVTIPRGFVEDYLFRPEPRTLRQAILSAYETLSKRCDVMVVEGTGHAGVGACVDLSNAEVAAMLRLKVLLVVEGGIGSTLDQVALNVSLFGAKKVEMLGVVANKIIPEKRDRIARALAQGLANMGQRFLGAIPYDRSITYPRVRQVAQAVNAEVMSGEEGLHRRINNVIIAAMEPQNVLPRLAPRSLMITPGDRVDNILVALNSPPFCDNETTCTPELHKNGMTVCVSGLILTGGFVPHGSIMNLLKNSSIPVLLCKENTYEVSSKVQGIVFKILPEDTDKIEQAKNLVREYVDTAAILEAVSGE